MKKLFLLLLFIFIPSVALASTSDNWCGTCTVDIAGAYASGDVLCSGSVGDSNLISGQSAKTSGLITGVSMSDAEDFASDVTVHYFKDDLAGTYTANTTAYTTTGLDDADASNRLCDPVTLNGWTDNIENVTDYANISGGCPFNLANASDSAIHFIVVTNEADTYTATDSVEICFNILED